MGSISLETLSAGEPTERVCYDSANSHENDVERSSSHEAVPMPQEIEHMVLIKYIIYNLYTMHSLFISILVTVLVWGYLLYNKWSCLPTIHPSEK